MTEAPVADLPDLPPAPSVGFLCSGELSVNVPGDEQVFPEAFAADLSNYQEQGAVIFGLWPSPQWQDRLEPEFWDVERSTDSTAIVVTGITLTEKTSLTSRITLDTNDGAYEIYWSVLPVGFTRPVEFWSSAGGCSSYGLESLEL